MSSTHDESQRVRADTDSYKQDDRDTVARDETRHDGERPNNNDSDDEYKEYLGSAEQDIHQDTDVHGETRSIFDRVKDRVSSKLRSSIQPRKVDDAVKNRIQQNVKDMTNNGTGRLLRIKPHPGSQGITGGREIMEKLFSEYRRKWFGLRNASPVQSFEIWMVEGEVAFHIYAHNPEAEERVIKQIDAQYPHASVERVWNAETVNAFLERQITDQDTDATSENLAVQNGDEERSYESRDDVPLKDAQIPLPPLANVEYAAAAECTLRHTRAYPIKSLMTVQEMDNDPYASITSSMIADERNHFVLQITFKPATRRWANTIKLKYLHPFKKASGEAAYEYKLQHGIVGGQSSEPALNQELRYADEVRDRAERDAFYVNIRIIGLGADKTVVQRGTKSIAGDLETKFKEWKQRFVPHAENGTKLLRQLDRCVTRDLTWQPRTWFLITPRKWFRSEPIVLPTNELGMLCHLPNGGIDTPDIDWELTKSGAAVPNDAEKFKEVSASTPPIPLTAKQDQEYGHGSIDVNRIKERIESDDTGTGGNHGSDATDQDATSHGERDHNTMLQNTDSDSTDPAPRENISDESPREHERHQAPRDHGRTGIDWLDDILHDDEEILYSAHPTRWVSAPSYIAGAALGLIGLLTMLFTIIRVDTVVTGYEIGTLPIEAVAAGIALIVFGAVFAGFEHVRRQNKWHVITNDEVIRKTGILRIDVEKIPMSHISSNEKSQTPFQRIVGIASIDIFTASTSGQEMKLGGVRDPSTVISSIDRHQSPHAGAAGRHHAPRNDNGHHNEQNNR
jgi:membrane protein YdbS with pleckstrin-like domain